MRKILLAEDSPDLNECYTGIINSYFEDHFVETFVSGNDLIERLKQDSEKIDLIISDILMMDGSGFDVVQYLTDSELEIPIVLISGIIKETNKKIQGLADYKGKSKFIPKPVHAKDFIEAIREIVTVDEFHEIEYTSVNPHILTLNAIVPTNIYIKLGDQKFVKIINQNDPLEDDFHEKLHKKDINKLFIKQKDIETFYEWYLMDLSEREFNFEEGDIDKEIAIQGHTVNLVTNKIKAGKVDETVLKAARGAIENNLEIVNNTKNLKALLYKIINQGDILFEHSVCTCFISHILLRQFPWNDSDTKFKLTIASLFHDVALSEFSKEWESFSVIPTEEVESLKETNTELFTHPMDSSSFVLSLKNIPPDTETIISNHHELPQGKGYPKKLGGNQLSMLCCIFITSHHFTMGVYKKGWSSKGISETLEEMETFFDDSNFTKVFGALKGCFTLK